MVTGREGGVMRNKGEGSIGLLLTVAAMVGGAVAYAHTHFVAKDEVIPELIRIRVTLNCMRGLQDDCNRLQNFGQ